MNFLCLKHQPALTACAPDQTTHHHCCDHSACSCPRRCAEHPDAEAIGPQENRYRSCKGPTAAGNGPKCQVPFRVTIHGHANFMAQGQCHSHGHAAQRKSGKSDQHNKKVRREYSPHASLNLAFLAGGGSAQSARFVSVGHRLVGVAIGWRIAGDFAHCARLLQPARPLRCPAIVASGAPRGFRCLGPKPSVLPTHLQGRAPAQHPGQTPSQRGEERHLQAPPTRTRPLDKPRGQTALLRGAQDHRRPC